MKTEKRILIREDKGLLTEIVQDLHRFKPTLTALTTAFSELCMGPFTNEIFKDLVDNGSANITANYKANLETELDKTGVVNPILRKTVLSASEPTFSKFKTAYTDLIAFTPPNNTIQRATLTLQYISFIDERFVVTEADQETLLESHCRVYLETDKEKAFHAKLSTLKDAFNAYLKDFQEYELEQKVHGFHGLQTFFNFDNMEVSINPESINYGVTVSEMAKKKHAELVERMQQKKDAEIENQRKFNAGELPEQVAWREWNDRINLVN